MNTFRKAVSLLPLKLGSELLVMPEEIRQNTEEIRLRNGKMLSLLVDGKEIQVAEDCKICPADISTVLERASCASLHAVENQLIHGYLSVEGGIRIGVCGSGVIKNDRLCGFCDFSSLSIRIPHEIMGCSDEAFEEINRDGIKSTLIISPPGFGKTTFLRDYIRNLSDKGYRVSVADERGELASMSNGKPQYDLGCHTDVMTGVSKAEAAVMMLKTMNPQVIAMDEISEKKDVRAVASAAGCGVRIIASAHASNTEDLRRRKIYRELMAMQIFERAVIIGNKEGRREYRIEVLT